ncbi:antibiotic biosynthesis monooxygenase family protein [Derxia gummosa]|uniref:Antibiotic biosynthesis monooxygenase family protein n=1 Tax=Derxia gummosa DSM 723 TaxID=1121388 RepID=A0A8B6X8N9_9BURK|nr:antibiotic biosynthesis monooxygenase [Derxia gummosa]
MFTSTFTFLPGDYDAEFHALDAVIAEAARGIDGYLGEESWENPATGLVSNVYYWRTREALDALMTHPAHIEAKRRQASWLKGYQVVIAEVVGSYGDGRIAHPLAVIGSLAGRGGAAAD